MEAFGRLTMILILIFTIFIIPIRTEVELEKIRAAETAADQLFLWAEKLENTGKMEIDDYYSVMDRLILAEEEPIFEFRIAAAIDWLQENGLINDLIPGQRLLITSVEPETIARQEHLPKNYWFSIRAGTTVIGGEVIVGQ